MEGRWKGRMAQGGDVGERRDVEHPVSALHESAGMQGAERSGQPRQEEADMERVQAERPGHNPRGESADPRVGPGDPQAPPQRPGEAADPRVGPGEPLERQPFLNGGHASSAGDVSYSNGHVDLPLGGDRGRPPLPGGEKTPSLPQRGVQRVRRLYRDNPKTVLAVVLALVVMLIITLVFRIYSASSSGTDPEPSTPRPGYISTSTASASGTNQEPSTPRPGYISTSTASEWETAGDVKNVSFYMSRERKDFTGSRNHCEGLGSRLIRDSDTQVVKDNIKQDTWINHTGDPGDCYVYTGRKYLSIACDNLRDFICVKDEKAS